MRERNKDRGILFAYLTGIWFTLTGFTSIYHFKARLTGFITSLLLTA